LYAASLLYGTYGIEFHSSNSLLSVIFICYLEDGFSKEDVTFAPLHHRETNFQPRSWVTQNGLQSALRATAGETVQGSVNPQPYEYILAWHDSFSAPSYDPNFCLRRSAPGGNCSCSCIKDDCGCIGTILAAPG
jgi:hypothetical protein